MEKGFIGWPTSQRDDALLTQCSSLLCLCVATGNRAFARRQAGTVFNWITAAPGSAAGPTNKTGFTFCAVLIELTRIQFLGSIFCMRNWTEYSSSRTWRLALESEAGLMSNDFSRETRILLFSQPWDRKGKRRTQL